MANSSGVDSRAATSGPCGCVEQTAQSAVEVFSRGGASGDAV